MSLSLRDFAPLLARIHTVEPRAHIAGGAVRDVLNGRPVKDIDVFVPTETDVIGIEVAIRPLYPNLHTVCTAGYIPGADPAVAETREYGPANSRALPLNLIFIRGGFSVDLNMRRFDFGLCQAAFDGERTYTTEGFLADKRMEQFTLTRCDDTSQFERSLKRYERIGAKYPGWPLVVPPHFAHLDTRITVEVAA